MTYRVLVNGSTPSESNRVIAEIEATDVSASICWVGIIDNDSGCNPYSSEQTYCETVYVGENTSTEPRYPSGRTEWHGNTIWYTINQSGATQQQECTTETYCSGGTNVWISPYVVTKEADGHNIKLYTEYSAITVTTCGETTAITNVEKVTSNGYSLSGSAMQEFEDALRDKACSNTDRTISVPYKLSDIVPCLSGETDASGTAVCYVAEEEHCCDNSGTSVCYEIGEIAYSPTSVPFSGGDVYYSFDYKKKTTVNCVTSTKVGTYTSSRWRISGRTVGEQDQCLRKQVTSSVTPSLDDFITCDRIPSSSITLSIWQDKNSSACTESSCTESIGYCVDKNSIKQYYYSNESGGTWVLIETPPYRFPFYGGQLKVTWEYSAITRYDDCSYSITNGSGNTWEDIKTIDPNDNCGEDEDTITLEYVFKTESDICSGGNKFNVTYLQEKSSCVQDCPSCINDGAITLECGYIPIIVYDKITSAATIIGYESGTTPLIDGKVDIVSSETQCTVNSYDGTLPEWLKISISGNNIIYETDKYNSGSSRSCNVKFNLGNECFETVTITQIGSGAEQDPSEPTSGLTCPCSNAEGLFFGVYSLGKIPHKGGSDITFASYGFEECVPPSSFTYSISTSAATFYDNITTSATTYSATSETEGIFIGNISANCDCVEDRVLYLDYAYTASGCSEVSGRTEITQSHANCICNKISAATVGNLSCSSGNGITIGTYQVTNDCPPSEASVSTTATFIKNIGLSYEGDDFGSGNITGDIISNYCSSSSRSGYVTITYQLDNGSNCTTSFLATQDAGTSVTLTPASTIPSTRGNYTLAEYSFTGEQPSVVTASVSDTSFISGVGITSDNKISGTVECNYCNSNSRTNVVTLTYGNGTCSCTEECFITQKGGASATLTASSDIPSTGGTVTLANYEITGEAPTTITASKDKDFITAIGINSANKTITGTVSSNYCNNTSRGATITLTYGKGSCTCTKSCNVTQVAGTSAVLVPSGEIPCIGGEDIILATYLITGDESPSVSVTVDEDFITNLTASNGVVKGTVTENCCKTNERTCELTLKYGPDECEKECILTQKGGKGGKKIVCTDPNYSPIDCSENPIETTSGGTLYLKLINDSNNT